MTLAAMQEKAQEIATLRVRHEGRPLSARARRRMMVASREFESYICEAGQLPGDAGRALGWREGR